MPNRVYGAIRLTGGSPGDLDEIDGDRLQDMDLAFAIDTATGIILAPYWLDADSGLAESIPSVIKPDTNAGDKRWILMTGIGVPYDALPLYIGPILLTIPGLSVSASTAKIEETPVAPASLGVVVPLPPVSASTAKIEETPVAPTGPIALTVPMATVAVSTVVV
jgi:hypothetical protein